MKLLNAIKILGLLILVSSCSDNHEYVDLGLPSGTLWATCNVGATKPSEYGDLFAWGETSPKEYYEKEDYKWFNDGKFTKYLMENKYGDGVIDGKDELDNQDDAAVKNWGDSWRMPTSQEIEELVDGCDWEWVDNFDNSGVPGVVGCSKKNGNCIFFPAAGYNGDEGYFGKNHMGLYWSKSLVSDDARDAHSFHFGFEFDDDPSSLMCMRWSWRRNVGIPVRAVRTCKKQ